MKNLFSPGLDYDESDGRTKMSASSTPSRIVRKLTRRDFLYLLAVSAAYGCGKQGSLLTPVPPASPQSSLASVLYLGSVLDQFQHTLDVYEDFVAAGNHFVALGKIFSANPGDDTALAPMDENNTQNPHSGLSCIRATFQSLLSNNWGGWYFMNGVLLGNDVAPELNWGTFPNAGLDLTGASKLTFWVRGEKGGEVVEFFCFGIGRDPMTGAPVQPLPDSSPKASTGKVRLSTAWTEHTIDLSGKDLSYVLGGFGWVAAAGDNNGQNIAFYIDDISYDKPRPNDLRFAVSYQTISSTSAFDLVLRNVSYAYDNAVALIAFLSAGDTQHAKLIADALVYAQQHDRFYADGRIRNAYQAGDEILPPGWAPNGRIGTVRMPGWYDTSQQRWFEDIVQVSTYVGNVAWAGLALLAFYETQGGSQYLVAAEQMGEWIEQDCRDSRGAGGYTAGFQGWEPTPVQLTYKATEHNIDLVALFERLFRITQDVKWSDRASHAKQFVFAMWDSVQGKFFTGTLDDGVTVSMDVIPLDVQAWSIMALRDEGKPYLSSLQYAETNLSAGCGFSFSNQDRTGTWYEGTAQMAAAYKFTGQTDRATALISCLHEAQDPSGSVAAASKDGLATGFFLPDGQPWLYYNRLHVGATGWLVLAENGINPFWFGEKSTT